MLDHALALAGEGFRVFPLIPGGKTPALATDWRAIATTDPERIRAMWWDPVMEVDQPYNIGIATGDGLVVLDVDNKNGKSGGAALDILEIMHGDLPPTYTVETPNGGRHLYFQTEERIGNAVGLRPGLDVRGEGGFVAAEGSRIGDRTYTRRGPDRQRAEIPAGWAHDVLPVLEDRPSGGVRGVGAEGSGAARGNARSMGGRDVDPAVAEALARDYLATAPIAVSGDGGNDTTYKVVCRVRDFGVANPLEALDVLGDWNANCAPPWPVDELLPIIESAYKHAQNPIGSKVRPDPEDEFEAVEAVDRRTVATALPVRNILSDGWKPFQNYLIKGLVNFGMVGFVAGAKNAGKSPLLLDLAAHVAKGEPWLGHRVRRAYVLYVATEGWTGIGNRLAAVRKVYFPDSEEVAIDYLAASIDLRTSPKSARAIAATARERAKVFGLDPGLIIIDTFSHTLAGGDDSNQAEVKPAIANLKLVAAETGAAVLVAHHPTKNGSSGVRGSSTIEDDTDLTIRVEQDPKGHKRRVTTPRVKDYGEITPVAFDIRTVELGEDQDGDPITSVVVSWRPSAEEEFDDKISEGDREALEALRDTLCRKGTTNATYKEWFATYCSVRGGSTTERGVKPRFNRSRTNLANQGIVGKDEEDQYVILR